MSSKLWPNFSKRESGLVTLCFNVLPWFFLAFERQCLLLNLAYNNLILSSLNNSMTNHLQFPECSSLSPGFRKDFPPSWLTSIHLFQTQRSNIGSSLKLFLRFCEIKCFILNKTETQFLQNGNGRKTFYIRRYSRTLKS